MNTSTMATLSRSYTAGILGVDRYVITVDAEVGRGASCLTIVGRVSGAHDAAGERVRAAINNAGHSVAAAKQIVHLAPAKAHGSIPGCDLAIACALLTGHGIVPSDALTRTMLWAELAQDGTLLPAVGSLIAADIARQQGFRRMIVAEAAAAEASMIPEIEVIAMRDLAGVVAMLRGEQQPKVLEHHSPSRPAVFESAPDLADVRGLLLPRLALEVMIAGGHNLLLHGPRGVGKTMLARRIPALMPDIDCDDALEVTKIHGIAHRKISSLITRPPLRMPHHTVSTVGLLGGGNPPRPGEVSLAHRGVLVLDELPEFARSCIEGLRGPLENGTVTLFRSRETVDYPARFLLMAAMNACPCGFLGHPEHGCIDSPEAVKRYQGRVSEFLLVHMDLAVPIIPLTAEELADAEPGEPSADVRGRILAARERQHQRLSETTWAYNAEISSAPALEHLCPLTDDARKQLLGLASDRNLNQRAVDQLRRVARTIQDLDPDIDPRENIRVKAVAMAEQLRRLPSMVGAIAFAFLVIAA